MDDSTDAVSVSDSSGNSYSQDATVINLGSGGVGVRTLVFSRGYAAGFSGNITVSVPSNRNLAATFFSFNDLVLPAADKSHTATGSGNSVSSGSTTTSTSQPDEVLIGAAGFADKTGTMAPG